MDRLGLLSFLYGPGTVSSWLLITSAMVLSWVLPGEPRRGNQFHLDFAAFLAFLALPLAAAGHLVYNVVHFPGLKTDIMRADDVALLPYTREIEAALNIMETFSILVPIISVAAIYCKQNKKALLFRPRGACLDALSDVPLQPSQATGWRVV